MNNTLGNKLSTLRKAKGLTQDDVAEKLGVSAQAVSKWENDISCPDIMALPQLAALFNTTVDSLLSIETKPETEYLPEEKRKIINDMMFKVIVNSVQGDKVRVNIPMTLVKIALEMGMQIPQISGNDEVNKAMSAIDVNQIMMMVETGVIGKLVEVESAQGDIVEVMVE